MTSLKKTTTQRPLDTTAINQAAQTGAVKKPAGQLDVSQQGAVRVGSFPGSEDPTLAFLGPKLAAALATVPQFDDYDWSNGDPAWSKIKLNEADPARKPWHTAGIFFEAESKLTFGDSSRIPAFSKALETATEKGLLSLLPGADAKEFAGWTVVRDKAEKKTDFADFYWDNAGHELAAAGHAIRERIIGIPQDEIADRCDPSQRGDGKYESKISGDYIQGSAILGRLESSFHTAARSVNELLDQARRWQADPKAVEGKEDYWDYNPVIILLRVKPDLDIDSLQRSRKVDDVRQQYVIKNEAGDDMYLITLDDVRCTATNAKGATQGKTVRWPEVECERMDGKIDPGSMGQAIKLDRALQNDWGLVRSEYTKDGTGAALLGQID